MFKYTWHLIPARPSYPDRPRWRTDRHPHQQRRCGNTPDRRIGISDRQTMGLLTEPDTHGCRSDPREALPHMIQAGRGSIVNTASVNASLPDPLVIDYSAAKAALVNFSKALSKEVGSHGIRVNTVSPGPVATDLWLGNQGVASTLSNTLRKPHRLPTKRSTRHRHPEVHHATRSSRPNRLSSKRPKRQHHRCRLHNRRWSHPKPLNPRRLAHGVRCGAKVPIQTSRIEAHNGTDRRLTTAQIDGYYAPALP